MINDLVEYQNMIEQVFPEMLESWECSNSNKSCSVKTITFQVTENCNLRCTYCYEINKSSMSMTFETAKKFIDSIIENRCNHDYFINEYNTKGLIIEFFGGEPLLNIDIIDSITDYFEQWFCKHPECPWSLYHAYNICSNGVLYFTDKVQNYLRKNSNLVCVNITVDGCRSAHDMCRLHIDGSPSYDEAVLAALHAKKNYGSCGTKITLAPDNIPYVYESITNMLSLGFTNIHVNCAFEQGWEINDARKLYNQLKLVCDYIQEKNLYDDIYISILDPDKFIPYTDSTIDSNWCGTVGNMLAIQPSGKIYTCCRFMQSSVGNHTDDLFIGDVMHGIGYTDEEKSNLSLIQGVTTRNQSSEECLNCSIGSGCSYCCAYNYQFFKEFKRTTFICDCHKAAALACMYLTKIVKDKESYDKIHVTKKDVLHIISEDEFNYISDFNN